MSEAPLMNDEAARSQTGEILDQANPPQAPTTTTTNESVTPTTPTTTSPTPDATTTPTDTTKPATPPAPTAVPDKYEFTAPEGLTVDPAAVEAATPIFKELGLTQDQAQKLISFQLEREKTLLSARPDPVAAMRTDWQAKVKADPDMAKAASGGKTGMEAVSVDIARLKAALPVDLRAEFSEAMDLTGAGDHPAIVKAMWKLAAFVTEGTHVTGAGPSGEGQKKPGTPPPSVANRLYPNLP